MSMRRWRREYADYSFMFDGKKKWVTCSRDKFNIRKIKKTIRKIKKTE